MNHVAEVLQFKASPALDHAITRIGELARECGDKDREIAKLKLEIIRLKNGAARPYKGCRVLPTAHGDAPILLEYEFQPAEKADDYFIGCRAQADLIRVWIGGEPFSYEMFSDSAVEQWEAACLEAGEGA